MVTKIRTQVAVLGSGPAGYSAAFRCADLGLKTTIIERYDTIGGVCLNVGCIPSKALLHITKVIEDIKTLTKYDIFTFDMQKINFNKIRTRKEMIVSRLNNSLSNMAKERKIEIINNYGKFINPNALEIKDKEDKDITIINFDYAIIATGSSSIKLPFIPYNDPRVWNSTDALMLKEIPKRMLIIGGGVIGLEIGTIYQALGSNVDVVEMLDQIIPAADEDIINIFTKHISKKINLILGTQVTNVEPKIDGIYVSMNGKNAPDKSQCYDVILVSVGRVPNSKNINIDGIGINVDNYGFICTDKQLRTNISNIFAIGDVIGQPMLAHKGMYEGHIAAEVISGLKSCCDAMTIPSITYTEPEIAWVGITEKEARKKGINYEVSIFPWIASGRAIASDCFNGGVTKLIFNKETHRIIGGAIVGSNGGELLGEISLAIEMGCDAEDIALTVHAHPTLHESIKLAAEIFNGSITDLLNTKIKKK